MAGAKAEIVSTIRRMSGRYAPYNIFSDWIEMCSISIQNAVSKLPGYVWKKREGRYKEIVGKYSDAEMDDFARMLVLLGWALTEDMADVLGEVYMEAGMGNKYTGQFFTPRSLSELCASLDASYGLHEEGGRLSLHEPSCGSGGMVIATCRLLKEEGFDYQRRLDIVAQDLDWKGVYMTYLQLSLIGCRATVVQGDTLCDPYRQRYPPDRVMRTPAMMGMLLGGLYG